MKMSLGTKLIPSIFSKVSAPTIDGNEEIIFNLRSTSRDIPMLGASTDEEDHSESETYEGTGNSEDEVIHRINTIKISSDEEGETSLAIEKVPENRYKDLTPREVNQVQVLRTFIVPPKEEKFRGKIIRHKPIIFYRSELANDDHQKDEWKEWDDEDNILNKEEVQIETSQYYGRKVRRLAKKAKLPKSIPRSQMENFEKLWRGSFKQVMGLDGKMKSSRGLGYESDKDLLNPEEACRQFF
jgi:hypothetical protein